MPRRYQLRRRAERLEATRRRIVEAAVDLHGRGGLAHTRITDVAARAGVGRQTVYRHFPDAMALVEACSGLYWERHPMPDPARWREVEDPDRRFTTALLECYAYHRKTEPMMARMLAEVPEHPCVRPYHDHWRRAADVIVSAFPILGSRRRLLKAGVRHAVIFPTWQSLARGLGLTDSQAVKLMRRLVVCGSYLLASEAWPFGL